MIKRADCLTGGPLLFWMASPDYSFITSVSIMMGKACP